MRKSSVNPVAWRPRTASKITLLPRRAFEIYEWSLQLLLRYPAILAGIIAISVFNSLAGGLSVGLVVPLVSDTDAASQALGQIPGLAQMSLSLAAMPLMRRVRIAASGMIGLALFEGFLTYMSLLLPTVLQLKYTRHLRDRVFERLLNVELRLIYGERTGDLYTILYGYTGKAGKLLNNFSKLLTNGLLIVFYTGLLMLISWQMTLLAVLLFSLANVLVGRVTSKPLRKSSIVYNEAIADVSSASFETISALKLIHIFARQDMVSRKYSRILDRYDKAYLRQNQITAVTNPLFLAITSVALGVWLIGSTFILSSDSSVWLGTVIPFLIIAFRVRGPVSALTVAQAKTIGLYPNLEAVQQFFDREDAIILEGGDRRIEAPRDKVSVEGITFGYHADGEPVLRDVTFDIPVGKMTAIVGPSGAGKSTLVDLIVRLYDPQRGRVAVDGVDVRDLDLKNWRSQIAVVSQDTFIFNDTVRNNLAFGREDATDQEIEQAARLANAHAFIMDLPDGYDTILGDRGVRLSGGQRQRIAIARATLADAEILILDEATSNLDSEAERAIQVAIETLIRDRTVLAIAHRLSTIYNADNIVLLADGEVVGQGTHEELIAREGLYRRLVDLQRLAEA